MSIQLAIFPNRGFEPYQTCTPTDEHDAASPVIPCLHLDGFDARIQLRSTDLAEAVRYLDRLSAVAGELADRLRARQDTALLAAVEASTAGGA